MLQHKNRMKGYSSEIFGVVIMLFIGVFVIFAVIENYVSVKSFFKENSNWFLAKDIAYSVVKCSSSEYGIVSSEKISDAADCVGMKDVRYKFFIKDLDTGEQWQSSTYEGSMFEASKEHTLFVSIKKPDDSVGRGVVHVTMYPQ